jgi:hypothetical protein
MREVVRERLGIEPDEIDGGKRGLGTGDVDHRPYSWWRPGCR